MLTAHTCSSSRAQSVATSKIPSATDVADADARLSFSAELEINEYPQQARWKVTQKDTVDAIQELAAVAVTARGSFVPKGQPVPPGERKLFLLLEGKDEVGVRTAKAELQRMLDEVTLEAAVGDSKGKGGYGKYNVL